MIKEFEAVREWGAKRGLGTSSFEAQFKKALEELTEIYDAYITDDTEELADGIGDLQVVLINLGKTVNMKAEDCLQGAFDVIELRKGLNKKGSFVRYGKLSDEDKKICDEKQGNPGSEYYIREHGEIFTPENFKS